MVLEWSIGMGRAVVPFLKNRSLILVHDMLNHAENNVSYVQRVYLA